LADEHAPKALQNLNEAGLTPVVLFPHAPGETSRPDAAGFPVIACPLDDPDCWGDEPTLVLDAARRSGATPSQAFMVCADPTDVRRASEAGCRPVLVLSGRTLDEVYGPSEPATKGAICAPDLETAVHYMIEESGHDAAVGTFPYAHVSTLDERARSQTPSRGDVQWLMTVVILAGLTVALGISYLLREFYQHATLPPQAYWLTLQFIPRALRGAIFLGIGGFIVWFALRRRPDAIRRTVTR
jgi:hypothetical protein